MGPQKWAMAYQINQINQSINLEVEEAVANDMPTSMRFKQAGVVGWHVLGIYSLWMASHHFHRAAITYIIW